MQITKEEIEIIIRVFNEYSIVSDVDLELEEIELLVKLEKHKKSCN